MRGVTALSKAALCLRLRPVATEKLSVHTHWEHRVIQWLGNLGSLVLPKPRLPQTVAPSAPSLGTAPSPHRLCHQPPHLCAARLREHHSQMRMLCNAVTLLTMALFHLTLSWEKGLTTEEGRTGSTSSPRVHSGWALGGPGNSKGTVAWMAARQSCSGPAYLLFCHHSEPWVLTNTSQPLGCRFHDSTGQHGLWSHLTQI